MCRSFLLLLSSFLLLLMLELLTLCLHNFESIRSIRGDETVPNETKLYS